MEGSSQVQDLWQGLDRLAFCENAILLELKNKSQGTTLTSTNADRQHRDKEIHQRQYSKAFLDDIALIASAGGGGDNVTAACLEKNVDQPPGLVIRIARNEGLDEHIRASLQEIVDMAKCW